MRALLIDLERLEYSTTREFQLKVHKLRVEERIPDTLLFAEHPPVITLGKNGRPENLLIPLELLEKKGIPFYRIERGGDITYHGPGQLVGYPIFSIKNGYVGIRPFIEKTEDALIHSLKTFGIDAQKRGGYIGVWVGEEKIASIGIAVKRWVTFHGFALNINTDLDAFKFINPCGLSNRSVTSLKKVLGREINLKDVKEKVRKDFEEVFDIEFTEDRVETLLD